MKRKEEIAARIRFNRILIIFTSICLLVIGCRVVMTMYEGVVSVFRHNDSEFIDISMDMKGGIPKLYQWDTRWKNENYGTSEMEISGCGPTCLSMVCCGLTGDTKWNPYAVAKMAEERGYYVPGVGTSWDLMTDGAKRLGLKSEQLSLSERTIRSELEKGHPIICAMGPGDFTTEGHFIVLTGVDEDGRIFLNDPNSEKLSERTWELDRLMSQMKNLWCYNIDD